MSSFNCMFCETLNLDSESGYISGCKHYPPELKGLYQVKVIDSLTKKQHWTRASFNGDSWVNQYDEIIEWKK